MSQSNDAGWDAYWSAAAGASAYTADVAGEHAVLSAFWREALAANAAVTEGRWLDIASGNGAVLKLGQPSADAPLSNAVALDQSCEALANLATALPHIGLVVGDAAKLPFLSGTFDIVTSQFGIEYAGESAFAEAARVVKPAGELIVVAHQRPGQIFDACYASLEVVAAIVDDRFFALARDVLESGAFAASGGARRSYDRAVQKIKAPHIRLEELLARHGTDVAGGMLARLLSDLGRLNAAVGQYPLRDAIEWLSRMDTEMHRFGARMRAMTAAALTEQSWTTAVANIEACGLTSVQSDVLYQPSTAIPLAWRLRARRI